MFENILKISLEKLRLVAMPVFSTFGNLRIRGSQVLAQPELYHNTPSQNKHLKI